MNSFIRKAEEKDFGRISEIEIFNYRLNFYPIFKSDEFYFDELNVLSMTEDYLRDKTVLDELFVYDEFCFSINQFIFFSLFRNVIQGHIFKTIIYSFIYHLSIVSIFGHLVFVFSKRNSNQNERKRFFNIETLIYF